MEIDYSSILVLCCHIKRNLFFEDSMRRLASLGINKIWIQNTSPQTFGTYRGPAEKVWSHPGHLCTWNQCLLEFDKLVRKSSFSYIFLVDFDTFIGGTEEFQKCVQEATEGEYDHISRFKNRHYQRNIDFKGKQIARVRKIDILPGDTANDWPRIVPNFATCWEFWSSRAWKSFSKYDLCDGRRMLRRAVKNNMKMGAHRTNYGPNERCWGKDWFHISDITGLYQNIGAVHHPLKLPKKNNRLMFKVGMFAAQERFYGSKIYPPKIKKRLKSIYNHLGGKSACLKAWDQEVAGTCMENWTPYK